MPAESPPEDAGARLRRAADLLEALRARTTGGRWEVTGLLASRPEIVARRADGGTEHVAEARARSAPWIAALAPTPDDTLSAWLRATADAADAADAVGAGSTPPAALEAADRFAATVLDRLDPR